MQKNIATTDGKDENMLSVYSYAWQENRSTAVLAFTMAMAMAISLTPNHFFAFSFQSSWRCLVVGAANYPIIDSFRKKRPKYNIRHLHS